MTSFFARIALFTGLFFVSACTSVYFGNVSSFHEMTAPGGERVMLIPMQAEKADSLEFKQYAGILASHLRSLGYQEPGEKEPELIAGFDVSISEGREKLRTSPSSPPYWRRGVWAPSLYWGHVYVPFHDPWGYNNVSAQTVYTSTLTFELRKPDGEMVYEGRAELESRSKDLPALMPYLADVLFEKFPGENGVTRKVKIEREPKAGTQN